MSEDVADFRVLREDALLNVDRAHKALEKINDEIDAAVQAATQRITSEFAPIDFAARSVLYEAMSKAAEAGFTYQQLCEVMGCDHH